MITVLIKQVKCRYLFTVYLHSWTTRCSETWCTGCVASSWNCDHTDTTARKQWLARGPCSYWSSCDMLRAVPRTVSRSINCVMFCVTVFFVSKLSGICSFFLTHEWFSNDKVKVHHHHRHQQQHHHHATPATTTTTTTTTTTIYFIYQQSPESTITSPWDMELVKYLCTSTAKYFCRYTSISYTNIIRILK